MVRKEVVNHMRISAVGYLNAAPLCWGLRAGLHPGDWTVSFDKPSACAAKLLSGGADVGLVPAATLAMDEGLVVAAPFGVAAAGEVTSVLLVFGGAVENVREVLLDPSSRTSQALSRVILERSEGLSPSYAEWRELPVSLREDQALLVIGDQALELPEPLKSHNRMDLAKRWADETGLPFVFAVWAARNRNVADEARPVLQSSYDYGKERIGEIARDYAGRSGFGVKAAEDYLTRHLHYNLGEPELKALGLFLRYAFGKEIDVERLCH